MASVESYANEAGADAYLLNPLQVADWDNRLLRFPDATIFHSSAWAKVLYHTYGYRPLYLVKSRSGEYQSIIPIMEVYSWLTGRRGVSLPFTDECRPLSSEFSSSLQLHEIIKKHLSGKRWKYVEYRGSGHGFPTESASSVYYGHRLNLSADETTLFSSFDSSVRRAVRKAEQYKLSVEFSQKTEAVTTFYNLLSKTRRRQGMPVQPLQFFKNIYRYILAANQGWIVLVKQGEIPVAGGIFFHFGRTATYKFGASDKSLQHLRANNLMMWHAIKWYASQGFSIFDFGRTSLSNENLRRYKLGWGTTEHRIDYFRYDQELGNFVQASDRSHGWYNRVFQIMPIFLSRLIGTIFYKHIA